MSCLFHLKPFYFNISVTWSSQSRSLSFNCTMLAAGCWGGTVLYENNLFLNENIHKCLTAISKIRPFLNSTCFSTFTHFSKNFSLTIVPLGVCPKIVEEHLLPSSTPEGWPKVKVSPSVCFGKKQTLEVWSMSEDMTGDVTWVHDPCLPAFCFTFGLWNQWLWAAAVLTCERIVSLSYSKNSPSDPFR